MCGGALEINTNDVVCKCEYCGTEQTLPRLDTDRKANLYDRANHFRRNNDYDKAMGIYEQILNEDNDDAEAYWSLVLCKYGIEYVEDPTTHKRVPTVNRAQYTSIFADEDYKSALQYANISQKIIYEQEAKEIDAIQKRILAISEKEDSFDVFICYKETDENGRRTQDSVLANDLYHQLIQEGYKVFFSRITLEDKLGQEYEPYIFAALNSSKVMVVLGTKANFFNAVWVKNEWSRYLTLIRNGQKKTLIPAYRDMDPYDLPEDFSHLQALDMSKLGFMQDLIRGIRKIIGTEEEKTSFNESVSVQQVGAVNNNAALLKRGYMSLEDEEWSKADDFFEDVLNHDAECAEAYLGKWLSKTQSKNVDELIKNIAKRYSSTNMVTKEACPEAKEHIFSIVDKYGEDGYVKKMYIYDLYGSFNRSYESNYNNLICMKEKAIDETTSDKLFIRTKRFAQGETALSVENVITQLTQCFDGELEKARQSDEDNKTKICKEYQLFLEQTDDKIKRLYNESIEEHEKKYQEAMTEYSVADSIEKYQEIKKLFESIRIHKDAGEYIKKCDDQIEYLTKQSQALKEKKKKLTEIIIAIVSVLIVVVFYAHKEIKYQIMILMFKNEKYTTAYNILLSHEMNNYKDSLEYKEKCESYYIYENLLNALDKNMEVDLGELYTLAHELYGDPGSRLASYEVIQQLEDLEGDWNLEYKNIGELSSPVRLYADCSFENGYIVFYDEKGKTLIDSTIMCDNGSLFSYVGKYTMYIKDYDGVGDDDIILEFNYNNHVESELYMVKW